MNSGPQYLNLFRLYLPPQAWVSVLHRITGVLLFLGLPLSLYLLQLSLGSAEGFNRAREFFEGFPGSVLAWALLSALAFHTIAGLRHLGLDMHQAISQPHSRMSAKLVLVISGVTAIMIGGWLW